MTGPKGTAFRKYAPGFAAVIAAVGLTAVVSHYLGRYQPFADLIHESEAGPYANLSVVVDDATIVHRLNSSESVTIKAKRVSLSRDRRTIQADSIYDSYISRNDGRRLIVFSAGNVIVQANIDVISGPFRGSVVVDHGVQAASSAFPQPRITCDRMLWDAQSDEVTCPGIVTLSLPGYRTVLSGDNLGYDVKSGNLNVSHIHGTFVLSDAVQ